WEARARSLIRELVDVNDVLYVDDLASLVYAGRTPSSDSNVARFLEPHLARGELAVIAESTPERFERVREEAPTFASLFRVVQVPAMTERESLPVLLGVLRALEEERSGGLPPRFSPAGLELLLMLVARFSAHEALPGKAVRLLRRVVSGPGKPDAQVRRFDVADVFEAVRWQTGLPDFVLGNAPKRPREQIRQELAGRVAGQPEAVEALTDAVLAMQASLQDPGKPLATYLFVGPTGVGKTEAAKALARYLFGSAERLVRFDMSEMGSSASIARFVGQPGAPDGELTTALRTQPFCVILLDEIEKAHPRVFDALLQLLGEGRLTDAAGRTVDARQSVIVMTSNLGVREAAARAGFMRGPAAEADAHYLSAVRSFFRPELFNRLDRVVPFRSLDKPALRGVVEHALAELLSRRGIRRGNVLVDVEPELLDLLVEQAFDPRYGARPLRRALEKRLTVPLAHHLVRRSSTDLALVELFRRGEELGLGVRLLSDAPAVPPERDPADWTLPELISLVRALEARVEALEASAEIAALRGRGAGASSELLERLGEVSEELRELSTAELSELQYVEEEDPVSGNALRAYGYSVGDHNRGRGGLRPRPAFREVPLRMSADVLLRQCRPAAMSLWDRMEILAHQARASARGDEAFTVLFECVGEHSAEALQAAVRAFPAGLVRAQAFEEGRRTYFTVEGHGVR
ncbi:MAG: AAA family ATPase, partial [Gemmatimonadetes bacterium]|nr:AAA family ATPase [Gemmatimonadota bacterium]